MNWISWLVDGRKRSKWHIFFDGKDKSWCGIYTMYMDRRSKSTNILPVTYLPPEIFHRDAQLFPGPAVCSNCWRISQNLSKS